MDVGKKLLAFYEFEYPHIDSHNVYFKKYEITDKQFSISFYNVLVDTAAIDIFLQNSSALTPIRGSNFFHVRCVFHIINLIVQASIILMNPYLEKIRVAILYFRAPSRHQQFLSTLKIFRSKKKRFNLDIKVHWNSTYLILLSCQNYSKATSSFYNEDE